MAEKEKNVESLKDKIWITGTLFLAIIVFILFASITIYIDPLFHYHSPLNKIGRAHV